VSREVWELGVRRGKSRRSRGSYEGWETNGKKGREKREGKNNYFLNSKSSMRVDIVIFLILR
jgi:hypothetical protein